MNNRIYKLGMLIPEPNKLKAMVRYQFQVDDDLWEEWKETVPRSKSLEQRIVELIEADKEGRITEENEKSE